jgi:steroid 5-alpha reductase family enzyme
VNVLPLVLWTWLALGVFFLVVYLAARCVNNYGIVDFAWSYAFSLVGFGYAFFATGWEIRRALLAAMVVTWSLRLGTHILIRVIKHHPEEDTRYQQLRLDWKKHLTAMMLGFFQLQGVSIVLLSIPFLIICFDPDGSLSWNEYLGALLWLTAITGESIADRQLARFKAKPANKGGVCDVGLWRYSRHPNYFFEWLIWVSYFIFGVTSPWGWVGIVSPLCILYLLLRVTGIPMTEKQSIRSRGDLYRRYQERTSAFIPWFPRA